MMKKVYMSLNFIGSKSSTRIGSGRALWCG